MSILDEALSANATIANDYDPGGAIVQLPAVENQVRSRGSRWCPATRSTTSSRG
jgi:hypothetical protein